MSATTLPIGSFLRIDVSALQGLIEQLQAHGYRVVGPQLVDSAIVFDELNHVDQLPRGVIDEQDGGRYRLSKTDNDQLFGYAVGPDSLKGYLFPARETIVEGSRQSGSWRWSAPEPAADPIAILGVRACDLRALAIQDKVFLSGDYVDTAYQARRESLFIVAVNCGRAASTCFCHAMDAGPAVTDGFDLALTELDDCLMVEVGTEKGSELLREISWSPCSLSDIERARQVPETLAAEMKAGGAGRQFDPQGVHDLLLQNLDHPHWEKVAQRCLSCANCTMVCPTCFCSTVEEVSDLTGEQVRRERSWTSCFTSEHSYMHFGVVRKSTQSRYRQWLTHKLATWHDQFDTSGCTGCGRCITWCPVGIDLTAEVAAIREDA